MPLRAIYLVLALALCSKSQPTSPSLLSVVSAWMIFSIDSFVHPCRQICTCNQSPVDTGLITVLIWHPAAYLVLARTHTANHRRGGISELKMSLHPCGCCMKTTYLQRSADESEKKRFLRIQGQENASESAEEGKYSPKLQLHRQSFDDSSRLCHRGRYHCLLNPPACLPWSPTVTVFTPRHAKAVSGWAWKHQAAKANRKGRKVDGFNLKRENQHTMEPMENSSTAQIPNWLHGAVCEACGRWKMSMQPSLLEYRSNKEYMRYRRKYFEHGWMYGTRADDDAPCRDAHCTV